MSYEWANRIRPLAICVFRRADGAILVAPGFDPVKQQRFYRPLGGEIEFGERAEDAVRREVREEVGCEIEEVRLLSVSENIFTYLGAEGHELVWTFEARLVDASMYEREVVECREGESRFEAHWVPLQVFLGGEAPLFPDGLLGVLTTDHSDKYDGFTMGMTHVDIAVANAADPQHSQIVRFLVDSGATYSVVPADILTALGIEPLADETFELANGDKIVRRKGVAVFRYKDRVGGSDVVFGDPGDANLLGVLTLESLGLLLDPLRRELRNLPMMLA